MAFVEEIFSQLRAAGDVRVLAESRDGTVGGVSGTELLELVRKARTFLASRGLNQGDRCGLLAPNSIRWVAMDLAIMAEGLIVVPLYSRQAPGELVAMMKDCSPSLICWGDAALRDAMVQSWPEAPPQVLFEEIFAAQSRETSNVSRAGIPFDFAQGRSAPQVDSDVVAIIYTSGTSGEPKG